MSRAPTETVEHRVWIDTLRTGLLDRSREFPQSPQISLLLLCFELLVVHVVGAGVVAMQKFGVGKSGWVSHLQQAFSLLRSLFFFLVLSRSSGAFASRIAVDGGWLKVGFEFAAAFDVMLTFANNFRSAVEKW